MKKYVSCNQRLFLAFLIISNPLFACVDLIQEGFLAGTLVQTAHGCKAIEDVCLHDCISADVHNSITAEQLVTSVSKHQIASYMKITIDNEVICAALDQKFYMPQRDAWVPARDIQQGDIFCAASRIAYTVHSVETIHQATDAYALTVVDHTYYVGTHGIRVHNMDVVATPLILGHFILSNPVVAVVQAVATAAVGAIAHQSAQQAVHHLYPAVVSGGTVRDLAIKQDRQLYIALKNEMLAAKKELSNIKRGLHNVAALYMYDPLYCTRKFLYDVPVAKDAPAAIMPSLTAELQMTDAQLADLAQCRDFELQQLEKQIVDLHISLMFHVDTLIDARDAAFQEWQDIVTRHQPLVEKWNADLDAISLQFALDMYEQFDLKELESIQHLTNTIKELKVALEFYKQSKNASLLHRTTDMVAVIAAQEQKNAFIVAELKAGASVNKRNIESAESVLSRHGANIASVRDTILARGKKAREVQRTQQIKQAELKRSAIKPPMEPQKDNDKDKAKHPYGLYAGAAYHNKHSAKYGKSPAPKNGQKALDNSVPCPKNSNNPTASTRRIGISDGEIVVLRQTSPGVYHGHVSRWGELRDFMQTALKNAGLVNNNGKII